MDTNSVMEEWTQDQVDGRWNATGGTGIRYTFNPNINAYINSFLKIDNSLAYYSFFRLSI